MAKKLTSKTVKVGEPDNTGATRLKTKNMMKKKIRKKLPTEK